MRIKKSKSINKRFLSILLCAAMIVGLMPMTAQAATTTTVNSASELQNAINNAGDGDTIKLGANITFNNSSQIKTVADVYQNWEILTYTLTHMQRLEVRTSVVGVPLSGYKDVYNPMWKEIKKYYMPTELTPEDSRGGRNLWVKEDGKIYPSGGQDEGRVRENGDATTYMLIQDKNLTIDLNGYTINATHNDAYFSALFVTGNSNVTIKGNGGITSSGTAITANGSGATVTVNGGNFKGDTAAVASLYSAKVYLNGGTFTGANVPERDFPTDVDLETVTTYNGTYDGGTHTGSAFETYKQTDTYKGTAIRTVPCATLFSEGGGIYIGETSQSTKPTFCVPGSGTLLKKGNPAFPITVRISRGIFDTPPNETYLAPDCHLLCKDDGKYEVTSQNDSRVIAQVAIPRGSTTYYTSLSKAAEMAPTGSTVTLLKDTSGEQILNNNSTYTIDLKTHTINGNVTVKSGNVTIKGGTINYTGTGNALKTEGKSAVLNANCTVNAERGTALSAGYSNTGGTVNATGGTYTGNLGTSGGTLTITGGRYKPNDPSAYLAAGFYAMLDSDRFYAVTDSPFIEIRNKDDLMAFAQRVNGGDRGANAVLMKDIDLSGVTWTPIGGSGRDQGYKGIFNGNGHSITNFNSTKGGLFESIEADGIVSNVTIKSGNISDPDQAGAIANTCSGTIQYCFNLAPVTGRAYVGGIAGTASGRVDCCGNSGNIKGEQFVGGIAGSSSVVTNCYNWGTIEATNAQWHGYNGWDTTAGKYNNESWSGAGGICGSATYMGASTANNCYNYGTVKTNGNHFVPVSVKGNNNWHLDSTATGSDIPDGYTSQGAGANVFASGELAWKLNGEKNGGVWYQTIGVDPYPVLDPTHATVFAEYGGKYKNYTFQKFDQIENITVPGGTSKADIISKLPKTVRAWFDRPGSYNDTELSWNTSPLDNYDPDNWEGQTITVPGTAHVTGLVNGGDKEVNITIEVSPVTVDGLWVEEEVTKQAYIDGDILDLSGVKLIITYNDVNRTEVELSYDSPGVTYSIGGKNNVVTHGMVLDKNKHDGTLRVYYANWIANVGQVRFLSTDNTIQEIVCVNSKAVYDGKDGYTITLPKGTPLPGPEGSEMPGKQYLIVRPTDYSVQSITLDLVEGRNDYWEITVVAESGHTATYYLQVLIDGWNKDAIDSLTQAWDGIDKTWKPAQAEVQQGTSEDGDENNLSYKAQLQAWLIQTMMDRGMEFPANVTADITFTKGPDWATAGDRYIDRDGEDGEFEFSITFTATQGSEDTHETVTFDNQIGTITATPYVAPDYTVHFNSNGGSEVADMIVKEDDVIGENAPTDPTLAHHTFLGWFTEQEGGEKWDMATSKVENDNTTLYAHWEMTKHKVILPENQHGYTLTADKTEAVWNDEVTFTYKLGVGYKGDDLKIMVNGTEVTPDTNGQFKVTCGDEDIEVTVDGVINAPTYTVTIPESVTLDSTATVSANKVNVADGSSLFVRIGGEFTIANDSLLFKQTIGYPIHKDSKDGTQIQSGDTVLTVAGGIANNSGSQILYFGLPTEKPKYADDYKGTVTFTIGIKDTE